MKNRATLSRCPAIFVIGGCVSTKTQMCNGEGLAHSDFGCLSLVRLFEQLHNVNAERHRQQLKPTITSAGDRASVERIWSF